MDQPATPTAPALKDGKPTQTVPTTRVVRRIRKLAETFSTNTRLRHHSSDLHTAANRIALLNDHHKRLRRQLRKLDPDNRVLKEIEADLF